MQGHKILHYDIRDKLGQGGMGEVYLARDTKLDRDVAIKFVPPNLHENPEARTRLLREAQAASRLVHPNIVAIFAIENAEDQDFIVMEYVRGQPLSDLIVANTLTIQDCLKLGRQTADALTVAHEAGVVHRDIKSSNILVTDRGEAKILDFGLATFYGATQVTDAGSTMGTAAYMSPEQTEGRPIDRRSDLFSFGVVLYEMIAGRRPFDGDNRNTVAYAIINATPEPLARFKTGVSVTVENIVAKALRKDPTERYQSAADMAADLKVAAREMDRSPGPPPQTPPQPYYGGTPQTPHTPYTPGSMPPTPGTPQTPYAPYAPTPGPYTPSYGQPPATPSSPSHPGQYPPASGFSAPYAAGHTGQSPQGEARTRSNTVKIVAIIVGGLIAVTALVAPHLDRTKPGGDMSLTIPDAPARGAQVPSSDDRVKIAVLPFKNQGVAEDEYFADGVTEEITARLATVRELGVIARTSVEQYKKTGKGTRAIGRELGVDYVLEGTVRWERGDGAVSRVRVTPQLINVDKGTSVWADVYDEPMTAVFKVQSNISKAVVEQLGVAMLEPEQAALDATPTDNIEAYDAYLKGMGLKDHWNSAQDMRVAASQFERATSLDPDFLMAFVRLSEVNADMVWFALDQSQQRVETSRRAAERAIAIAPNSPDANWAMGWYYYHGRRDLDNALSYLEPVLEKRPNSSDAHAAVAYVQRRQGRFDEANANLLRAVELSPNDQTLWYSIGETYTFVREYAKGRPYLDRATELRPELPFAAITKVFGYLLEGDLLNAHREAAALCDVFGVEDQGALQASVELARRDYDSFFAISAKATPSDNNSIYRPVALLDGVAYLAQGKRAAAKESFQAARFDLEAKALEDPADFRYQGALGVAYAGLGMKDEALKHANRAIELMPPSSDAMRSSDRRYELAWTMILLGDYDAAIDQLEVMMSTPSWMSAPYLRANPVFDPLRDNPRFQALLTSS